MNFQLLCLLQGKVALDDVNENPRTLRPGVRLAVLKVTLANEEVLFERVLHCSVPTVPVLPGWDCCNHPVALTLPKPVEGSAMRQFPPGAETEHICKKL